MVETKNICKLCNINSSCWKEAHIVPKFLTKALFNLGGDRHAKLLYKGVQKRKVQDTFKIANFICDECEKKFEVLETSVARKIQDIHNCMYLPEHFDFKINGTNQWIECKTITAKHLKLFFYSIIWRMSASSSLISGFEGFKLDDETEHQIQKLLNSHLSTEAKALKKNVNQAGNIPFYLCVYKPKTRLYPPRSALCAQSARNIHIVSLGEFFVIFYITSKDIPPPVIPYANHVGNFKIILAEQKGWDLLNKSFTKIEFID